MIKSTARQSSASRECLRSAGDNGQHRMRRVRAVNVHSISRNSAGKRPSFRFGGIGIDVEMREVAARNVESNAMAALEQIARRKRFDADCVDFARHHRRRFLVGRPETFYRCRASGLSTPERAFSGRVRTCLHRGRGHGHGDRIRNRSRHAGFEGAACEFAQGVRP